MTSSLPLLAYHFLRKYSDELGKEVKNISAEAMRILSSCRWPGNIRELENTIQRVILLADNSTIKSEILGFLTLSQSEHIPRNIEELKEIKKDLREKSIEEVERVFITEALKRNEWNISRTASDVGMQRSNFHALIKKYRISRPK